VGCDLNALHEIEVDETVFRKTSLPGNQVEWHEYFGAKRRGDRTSLVMEQRAGTHCRSTKTKNGKAAPPPMTVVEWQCISKSRIGEGTLVHADGAPAYARNNPGVAHDQVNHSTRNGGPFFTKKTKHILANGKAYESQAGTQSLDSIWGWTKKNMFGVKAACPQKIRERVREFQWRHWIGVQDRWVAAGDVLRYKP